MADTEPRGMHVSDKQLVFAFMAATVLAVVVFLFGVLVGRGVQQARGPLADDGPESAAARVVADAAPADSPVADGEPPPERGGAGGGDRYTYPARLGASPPEERVSPLPPAMEGPPRPADPPEVPAEPVAPASAPAAEARYTVQLAAVTRRDEADAIVTRLKAKGYDAFVLAPGAEDRPARFRVRIGSFKDKRQAELLAQRLLLVEKRYKPWVTR